MSVASEIENDFSSIELSIVIPVSERHDDLQLLYSNYASELSSFPYSKEFIFILDGPHDSALEVLQELKSTHQDVRIIQLNHWVGEATALSVGFENARGRFVITLASYFQVEPVEIKKILSKLIDDDDDLVVSWRYPRGDSLFNRMQSKVFHWLVNILTGESFRDISCGVRAMKAVVAKEVPLYGDLHRFFPLLAFRQGFRVSEVQVQQSHHDHGIRLRRPGVYLRRLLDLLALFFLFKFTKKPLRFFGLLGASLFTIGSTIVGYLGFERIFLGVGLSNRPLLIAGALMMVLGVQLFSVGLLGEIIIFTHSRDDKEYQVREILGS